MAGGLHGSARTMPRVRAEVQASQERTSILAQRFGLSRTTVNKWRSRTTTADAPMGPTAPCSTVLTPAGEAMVVEFRRRTLLPLDDVPGCLRDSIQTRPGPACIGAWHDTVRRSLAAEPACPKAQVRRPGVASSPTQQSASSTSTSASCASLRASSTCSRQSIACPNSPMSSSATTLER